MEKAAMRRLTKSLPRFASHEKYIALQAAPKLSNFTLTLDGPNTRFDNQPVEVKLRRSGSIKIDIEVHFYEWARSSVGEWFPMWLERHPVESLTQLGQRFFSRFGRNGVNQRNNNVADKLMNLLKHFRRFAMNF